MVETVAGSGLRSNPVGAGRLTQAGAIRSPIVR